jgi:hypothetical protein
MTTAEKAWTLSIRSRRESGLGGFLCSTAWSIYSPPNQYAHRQREENTVLA